jgi:exopolyphosphatase / guanosine-5'-triphosphate,3'-diphosphate pyrophosphatase
VDDSERPRQEVGWSSRFEWNDPVKARLKRIGVIDVGSNSVRLVIFDGMARSPAYFYNEKVLCGLGAGLSETGRLSEEGWQRAMATLRRFSALCERMRPSGLVAVATAAVRDAEDGPAFCAAVEKETGLRLSVASGAEEARLAGKGVLLGWPDAEGLVCDMGGSSMELARVGGGEVGDCATSSLGPLKLRDLGTPADVQRYTRRSIKALRDAVPGPVERLFLVGGSWRAIARLDMERVGYALRVLHGYEPPITQLMDTLSWIPDQSPKDLSKQSGTSLARLSLVPLAAQVLAELIRRCDPDRVAISAYGLREGLLYRQMPEEMRTRDPLIEACLHMEAAFSRTPGFGDALFHWLLPLYEGTSAADLRLIRAACLLHDINWRAHPDFRAELCFESVTRANVSGLDHPGRVFLGLALMHRYKSGSATPDTERFRTLLPPARAAEAMVLGKAMRLGAMLSGAATGVLEHARLAKGDKLTLTLAPAAHRFLGDVVERRLASLAQRLELPGEVVLA